MGACSLAMCRTAVAEPVGAVIRVALVRRLSSQQRASLELQGKYVGTMRGLKPGRRAMDPAKGIRAAIKAAERMAG